MPGNFKAEEGGMAAPEETRTDWANYGLRQLPWASVSFRGHPLFVWMEDGNWKLLGKMKKKTA